MRDARRYAGRHRPNVGCTQTIQLAFWKHENMLGNQSIHVLRTLFAGALLGLLLPGSIALAGAKGADDSGQSPTDLSELGLEALLEGKVVPISVLGTHPHRAVGDAGQADRRQGR